MPAPTDEDTSLPALTHASSFHAFGRSYLSPNDAALLSPPLRRARGLDARFENAADGAAALSHRAVEGERSRSRRRKRVWKKLMWVKQSYPDNYTDQATFLENLQRNPRLKPYDFWPLVTDSFVILQHVCSVIIFIVCFVGIFQERVSPVSVVSWSSFATILGWIVWERWVLEEDADEALNASVAAATGRSGSVRRRGRTTSIRRPSHPLRAVSPPSIALSASTPSSSAPAGDSSSVSSTTTAATTAATATPPVSTSTSHMNGNGLAKQASSWMTTTTTTTKTSSSSSSSSPSSTTTTTTTMASPPAANGGPAPPRRSTSSHGFPLPREERVPAMLENRTHQRLETVKSAVLIYSTLLGLSPILKSLTRSTSSDSIYAMSFWLLAINVFFFDYSGGVGARFPASLSTNAALMASTVLASRLPSTKQVFSLTLFSIEVFGLFPVFRRHLRHRSARHHALLTVLLVLGAGSGVGLVLGDAERGRWPWKGGLLGLVVGVLIAVLATGGCSWWLIGLQKYKNEIRGPWDPARPIIMSRTRWEDG